jgi:hypothetical protein
LAASRISVGVYGFYRDKKLSVSLLRFSCATSCAGSVFSERRKLKGCYCCGG